MKTHFWALTIVLGLSAAGHAEEPPCVLAPALFEGEKYLDLHLGQDVNPGPRQSPNSLIGARFGRFLLDDFAVEVEVHHINWKPAVDEVTAGANWNPIPQDHGWNGYIGLGFGLGHQSSHVAPLAYASIAGEFRLKSSPFGIRVELRETKLWGSLRRNALLVAQPSVGLAYHWGRTLSATTALTATRTDSPITVATMAGPPATPVVEKAESPQRKYWLVPFAKAGSGLSSSAQTTLHEVVNTVLENPDAAIFAAGAPDEIPGRNETASATMLATQRAQIVVSYLTKNGIDSPITYESNLTDEKTLGMVLITMTMSKRRHELCAFLTKQRRRVFGLKEQEVSMNLSSATLLFATFMATGCMTNPANSEKYLRAEPASHFTTQLSSLPAALKGITLRCIEVRAVKYNDDLKPQDQCMYVSADLTNLDLTKKQDDRNFIVDYLMTLADTNCSTFMARSFAAKAGWETERSVSKDILTSIAAAITQTAPHTATILGLVNLGVGSTVDNLDQNYYMKQTFSALHDAVDVERKRIKGDVVQRKKQADYTLPQALSDLRSYDDACSIQGAIASMARIAADKNTSQTISVEHAQGIKSSRELEQNMLEPKGP